MPLPPDNCIPLPCENGGICINYHNGYICHCEDGFTGVKCGQGIQSDLLVCNFLEFLVYLSMFMIKRTNSADVALNSRVILCGSFPLKVNGKDSHSVRVQLKKLLYGLWHMMMHHKTQMDEPKDRHKSCNQLLQFSHFLKFHIHRHAHVIIT